MDGCNNYNNYSVDNGCSSCSGCGGCSSHCDQSKDILESYLRNLRFFRVYLLASIATETKFSAAFGTWSTRRWGNLACNFWSDFRGERRAIPGILTVSRISSKSSAGLGKPTSAPISNYVPLDPCYYLQDLVCRVPPLNTSC